MQVASEEIPVVAQLVRELRGVVLDQTKGYLIESRLSRLAEALRCATFRDLVSKARAPGNAALRGEIINAITTQETLFFRDSAPFEALQHRVLPDLIDAKGRTRAAKRLRIWSAACSTGQEPYSIAMTLRELLPDFNLWDIMILATDISENAIRQASLGRYASHEIQRGMKPQLLGRYFTEAAGGWKVKDELRAIISFAQRNLLQPFPELGPFDVILCRNVAIYFDAPARRSLFNRLSDRLTPEGCLFVGSSECLTDLGPQFVPQNHCRATYYQPNKKPASATCLPAAKSVAPATRPAAASIKPLMYSR